MAPRSLALLLIVLLLVVTLGSGLWLSRRLFNTVSPPPPPIPPTTVAAVANVATATPLRPPPGYRLAGVALGEPDSFAVVEAPSGSSALYHLDDDVPGLGRLLRIDAERIVVQSTAGQFELWIAPAPTATPTRGRTPTVRRLTPTPTAKPRPQPAGADTVRESTPSGAPD